MRFDLLNESRPVRSSASLQIQINAASHYQAQIVVVSSGRFLPVEDGAAKWTRVVRATQEEIPDRVCKLLRLRVGCEAHSTSRAANADRHYLSFCLARLNI